jgi:hypothetical protein
VTLPAWDDPTLKHGTMVRTALWLVSEVGEGNTFTKRRHREAFPERAQADRRLRDLRKYGWVIHTSGEDAALGMDEQRFVHAGLPVWEPEARKAVPSKALTAKQRSAIFEADGYQCVVCGIAGGESYPDDVHATAVLSVSRRSCATLGGTDTQLVTECKRCRAGEGSQAPDLEELASTIEQLDASDRARLLRWMARGRRGATPLDRAWTSYRRMPSEARAEMRMRLEDGPSTPAVDRDLAGRGRSGHAYGHQ